MGFELMTLRIKLHAPVTEPARRPWMRLIYVLQSKRPLGSQGKILGFLNLIFHLVNDWLTLTKKKSDLGKNDYL